MSTPEPSSKGGEADTLQSWLSDHAKLDLVFGCLDPALRVQQGGGAVASEAVVVPPGYWPISATSLILGESAPRCLADLPPPECEPCSPPVIEILGDPEDPEVQAEADAADAEYEAALARHRQALEIDHRWRAALRGIYRDGPFLRVEIDALPPHLLGEEVRVFVFRQRFSVGGVCEEQWITLADPEILPALELSAGVRATVRVERVSPLGPTLYGLVAARTPEEAAQRLAQVRAGEPTERYDTIDPLVFVPSPAVASPYQLCTCCGC
jgi:hypothetical protein